MHCSMCVCVIVRTLIDGGNAGIYCSVLYCQLTLHTAALRTRRDVMQLMVIAAAAEYDCVSQGVHVCSTV